MNTSRKDYDLLVYELDRLSKTNKELIVQIDTFCEEMKAAADWARNFRRNHCFHMGIKRDIQ